MGRTYSSKVKGMPINVVEKEIIQYKFMLSFHILPKTQIKLVCDKC
jgi:hypothetical protein